MDPSATSPSASPTGPDGRLVLESLPGAVLVIDPVGTVTLATAQAAALAGRTVEQMVGTSVLEYVDPDAAWEYAASMQYAMDEVYEEAFSGPVRMTVVGSDGRSEAVDLWTANRLDDPELGGLVVLLAPPTVAMGIAEAVATAATGAPIEAVASVVAGSLAGYPCLADAAVVSITDDGPRLLARHGVPAPLVDGTAGHEPWAGALSSGERTACTTADLPPTLRDLSAAAGYRSLWVEPASLGGRPATDAVVAFRRYEAEPTPNELSYLHQAAATLALARLRPPTA